MKKNRTLIILLAVSTSLLISSCQKSDKTEANRIVSTKASLEESVEDTAADKSEESAADKTGITDSFKLQYKIGLSKGNTEGMEIYSSCSFTYDEKEFVVSTLVPKDMLEQGELMLDDKGHVLIQIVCQNDSYILFDDTVQLGIPEADVWTDEQDNLHVVLRDIRTAKYQVTDFIYDSENKEWVGSDLLHADGINYMGTIGK